MPIKPNASPDLQDCPRIKVAGQEWPVPLLAPRQNRKIIPGLMSLKGLKSKPDELTEAQFDTLLDIVYLALTRAHPDLKKDEFMDWPVPAHELLDAFPVIAMQTGVVKSVPNVPMPGSGAQPAGEAQSLQTGTP